MKMTLVDRMNSHWGFTCFTLSIAVIFVCFFQDVGTVQAHRSRIVWTNMLLRNCVANVANVPQFRLIWGPHLDGWKLFWPGKTHFDVRDFQYWITVVSMWMQIIVCVKGLSSLLLHCCLNTFSWGRSDPSLETSGSNAAVQPFSCCWVRLASLIIMALDWMMRLSLLVVIQVSSVASQIPAMISVCWYF